MLTQTLFVMLSKAKHLFFNAILRSFTFVQDDKFAKNKSRVNCYIIAYFFVNCNLCLCCVFVFPRQTQGQFLYFLRFQR